MRTPSLLRFLACAPVALLIGSTSGACGGSNAPAGFDDMDAGGSSGSSGNGTSPGDSGNVFGDAIANGTGAQGKACVNDVDCGSGGVCDPASHTCGCGGVAVASQVVAPNILLVEDRSCSMRQTAGAMTKWEVAVAALTKMTMDLQGKVRFGLSLFPDRTGDSCAQDALAVPIAAGAETAIQTMLSAALQANDPLYPSGPCVTNIDTAMMQADAEPALADKTRSSNVVLITDGGQSGCSEGGGNTGTIAAIADLLTHGVGTFVVGFGASVDTASLDSFAAAGGRVNAAGPHQYYDAQDNVTLDAALAAIGKVAGLSCDITLAAGPPNDDASLIYVYLDRTPPPVPRDTTHANGWDYDAATKTVHLYGAACDKLKTGSATTESVVFGCAGGAVPPPK